MPFLISTLLMSDLFYEPTHLNCIIILRILEVQGRGNGICVCVWRGGMHVKDIRRKEQINKSPNPSFILLAETQTLDPWVLCWRFIDQDEQKPRDWQHPEWPYDFRWSERASHSTAASKAGASAGSDKEHLWTELKRLFRDMSNGGKLDWKWPQRWLNSAHTEHFLRSD